VVTLSTCNVKTLEKWRGKHSRENKWEGVKKSGYVCLLGKCVEKNGKTQNEISERI
jgi:hypothetical protein